MSEVHDRTRDLLEQAVLAKHTLEELLTPIADGNVEAEQALSLSERLGQLASAFKVVAAVDDSAPTGTYAVESSFRIASVSREMRSRLEGHLGRRDHHLELVVALVMTAEQLDPFGTVTDPAGLQPFAAYVKETFERRLLNEVLGADPTNERLAHHLGHWFVDNVEPNVRARLRSVRVTEPSGVGALWQRLAQ